MSAHELYRATPGRVGYGITVGVLCLHCNVPFVPGDVGNAESYGFPVQYLDVEGATCDSVLRRRDPAVAPAFVAAAKELQHQGVRVITGDCGYMVAYQRAVADAVEIPVLLSSLLQLPLLLATLGRGRKLALMVADDEAFSPELLVLAGVRDEDRERIVIRGMQRGDAFRAAILDEVGTLDRDAVAAEVVATAQGVVADEPAVSAFMLECSNLPPYSAEISRATGLPVFDWIGFIQWARRAAVPPVYQGAF